MEYTAVITFNFTVPYWWAGDINKPNNLHHQQILSFFFRLQFSSLEGITSTTHLCMFPIAIWCRCPFFVCLTKLIVITIVMFSEARQQKDILIWATASIRIYK